MGLVFFTGELAGGMILITHQISEETEKTNEE